MLSLFAALMLLHPAAAGGNGHHWGWRNQAPRPVVPYEQVTPPPPSSGQGYQDPANGSPTSDGPGAYKFDN